MYPYIYVTGSETTKSKGCEHFKIFNVYYKMLSRKVGLTCTPTSCVKHYPSHHTLATIVHHHV